MEDNSLGVEILKRTLRRCDPEKILLENIDFSKGVLKAFEIEEKIEGNVYLISVGKAACKMARVVAKKVGRIKEGIAITKEGYSEEVPGVEVIVGGHPLPSSNSVRGAKRAIQIAKKAGEGDLVIVLISGGGSSLMAMPSEGISLEDLRRANKILLSSGMKIQEINTVRRHIDEVKGGKLLKRIMPAKCITIAISDVVGDPPHDIASGPTFPDPSTFDEALSLLEEYGITKEMPKSIVEHLTLGKEGKIEENPKEFPPEIHSWKILGSEFLIDAARKSCKELGLNPYVFSKRVEGEAKSLGNFLAELCLQAREGKLGIRRPACLIGTGEVSVYLGSNWGKGGPNQEVALSASIYLRGEEGIWILSADTDGTDGPTDAAGGIVDGESYGKMRKAGIIPERALRRHESYEALRKCEGLIKTGPTGNNMNDIYFGIVL